MNRRAPPQQLYSILVGNINRLSHLQLFGRDYLEKRVYLKKLTLICLILKLLSGAVEEFLHQAVMSPTRRRTGHISSTFGLVFSNYSSSILSISYLTPLGQKRPQYP